jgi:hypothetical protein
LNSEAVYYVLSSTCCAFNSGWLLCWSHSLMLTSIPSILAPPISHPQGSSLHQYSIKDRDNLCNFMFSCCPQDRTSGSKDDKTRFKGKLKILSNLTMPLYVLWSQLLTSQQSSEGSLDFCFLWFILTYELFHHPQLRYLA